MLVEPHYRLAFLSWWPHAWRSPYLRLMRKGKFYDCEPLQLGQLETMLDEAGFRYRTICIEAWRATFEIERTRTISTRILRGMPDACYTTLRWLRPTLTSITEVRRLGVGSESTSS